METVVCTQAHQFEINDAAKGKGEDLTCPQLVKGKPCGAELKNLAEVNAMLMARPDATDFWALSAVLAVIEFWRDFSFASWLGWYLQRMVTQAIAVGTVTVLRRMIPRNDVEEHHKIEDLFVELPTDERAAAADEMLAINNKIKEIEERKTVANSRFKAELETEQKRLNDVFDRIGQGKRGPVAVTETFDFASGMVTVIRDDNGATLRSRPMTASERQQSFKLHDKESKPKGRAGVVKKIGSGKKRPGKDEPSPVHP